MKNAQQINEENISQAAKTQATMSLDEVAAIISNEIFSVQKDYDKVIDLQGEDGHTSEQGVAYSRAQLRKEKVGLIIKLSDQRMRLEACRMAIAANTK